MKKHGKLACRGRGKKRLKINSVMITMCIVEAASPEPEVS